MKQEFLSQFYSIQRIVNITELNQHKTMEE